MALIPEFQEYLGKQGPDAQRIVGQTANEMSEQQQREFLASLQFGDAEFQTEIAPYMPEGSTIDPSRARFKRFPKEAGVGPAGVTLLGIETGKITDPDHPELKIDFRGHQIQLEPQTVTAIENAPARVFAHEYRHLEDSDGPEMVNRIQDLMASQNLDDLKTNIQDLALVFRRNAGVGNRKLGALYTGIYNATIDTDEEEVFEAARELMQSPAVTRLTRRYRPVIEKAAVGNYFEQNVLAKGMNEGGLVNRQLMSRQMFARGGAAFPDLSGDGEVTQKDILMGRGVLPMQQGGMAPMPAPAAPGPQMMPPGVPPIDPNSVDINQAAQSAMQQGIDPAVLEGMLTDYATGLEDLENAEDYETVINGIRGDQAPIEQRYQELASVVGQEDAQATPESVLTLVQPVMQIALVDQGIGGLAAEEMSAPVEGAMAEGIMSTVNMGGPEQAQGGPAPVNFNQGGAVQYMEPGGVRDPRMQALYDQQLAIFSQIDDPAQRAADLEQQRDMTKAGILFDIAQGALGFAGGAGRPGATPAEQLATAFQPVLGNIGARAGELNKFQMSQKAADRQLRLGALQSAGQLYGAERSAEIAREDKPITDTFTVTIKGKNGETTQTQRPLTQGQYASLVKEHGQNNITVAKVFKPTGASKAENFLYNGSIVSAVPGTVRYNQLVSMGAPAAADVPTSAITDRKQFTFTMDITVDGETYPKGSSPYLSPIEMQQIVEEFGPTAITAYEKPITDQDYFDKFKMTKEQFEALPKEDQQFLQGLPVITNQDYFDKFGVDKNQFLTYPQITQQRLLGIEPEYRYEKIDNGRTIDILRFDKNDPDAEAVSIYSSDIAGDPDFFNITMPSPDNPDIVISSIVDVSTKEGQAAVAKVNEINKTMPGAAKMKRIGTESTRMSAFLVPGDTLGGGASVRMSYDGGQTYVGADGMPRLTPPNAFALSDTIAYDVYRREKVRSNARQFLNENDNTLNNNQYFGAVEGGAPIPEITKEDKALVKDVLQQIRNGTGPWSSIAAGTNAVVGGLIAPETFSTLFKETEEGRQFAKLVYVLGRSALASNPRLAIADLEVTGTLFPNPDNFFGNPVTEANKIVSLMKALDDEEIRLQQMRASESPVDSAQLAIAEQKLGEISRLKNLLGPVSAMVDTASPTDITRAQEKMKAILDASRNNK